MGFGEVEVADAFTETGFGVKVGFSPEETLAAG
jgi:hypothetical protein